MTDKFTYSFVCGCKAILDMEISNKIDYVPKCLKCGGSMQCRYSIDNNGLLWLNEAILHE